MYMKKVAYRYQTSNCCQFYKSFVANPVKLCVYYTSPYTCINTGTCMHTCIITYMQAHWPTCRDKQYIDMRSACSTNET